MFKTAEQLNNSLNTILDSPKKQGEVELIVCRPEEDKRKELKTAEFDIHIGLVGDNWLSKASSKTVDNSAHPDMQINIMNARVIEAISEFKSDWQWAGDQLYVNLDLSYDNIPPNTLLSVGTAILKVTDIPHTGCKKFSRRFGVEAVKWVNNEIGKANNFRGINAKVVKGGVVTTGDKIVVIN